MGTNRAIYVCELVLAFIQARFVVWVKKLYQLGSYEMKFILGTKTGMTQVFNDAGICQAATVLKVTPATVSQVRTVEKDGYAAVQVASGTQKESRVAKAQKAHFGGAIANAKEFRPRKGEEAQIEGLEKGSTISVAAFAPGDNITVSAISKGKGFQGVVKRHGFKGGRRSHGQKHSEREPGSIGIGGIGRVLKGTRMGGRMGGDVITVKNLTVLQVNEKENLLVVAGAVPGRKGTLVEVYGA